MIRRIHRLFFIVGVSGLVALVFWPYHDGVLRYGGPLAALIAWLAVLGYLWERRFWRVVWFVFGVAMVIPFFLPEKPMDTQKLRERYVAALERMEGTRYVWGGESRWGIDCSGLPRRALRDGLWEEGMENGNGAAFRMWAEQWWFDTSAKALGQNYRGFTRPIGMSGKLRDLDREHLLPGDLAVTADGRHVLVYLREGNWIQAEPMASKVIIGNSERDQNAWFTSVVTMHRWMAFE